MRRVAFVVSGRVQGVGYRRFAQRAAEAACIAGFVRNEADGTVVGEAQGEGGAVEAFMAALRRGPALSKVLAVATEELQLAAGTGFVIR